MGSIVYQVNQIIKERKEVKDTLEAKKYREASNLYESLVVSGMTKKRGNNLLSRNKVHISSVKLDF